MDASLSQFFKARSDDCGRLCTAPRIIAPAVAPVRPPARNGATLPQQLGLDGIAGVSGTRTLRATHSERAGKLTLLALPGLLQGGLAREGEEQHARPGLLSALRTAHAAAVEEPPAAPPRSGVLLSERHAVVAPAAPVAAPVAAAPGFLQQAKAALSKREYIRVCADGRGSSYLLPVLSCACLLTLFLSPYVQFQELLQAFKSNAITFEVLAEGAKRAVAANPCSLDTGLVADVATLLRAATDPALFAAFGAFVPAHQQVRGRLSRESSVHAC